MNFICHALACREIQFSCIIDRSSVVFVMLTKNFSSTSIFFALDKYLSIAVIEQQLNDEILCYCARCSLSIIKSLNAVLWPGSLQPIPVTTSLKTPTNCGKINFEFKIYLNSIKKKQKKNGRAASIMRKQWTWQRNWLFQWIQAY